MKFDDKNMKWNFIMFSGRYLVEFEGLWILVQFGLLYLWLLGIMV